MKSLKIVGVGLVIWGMTLLWPEINLLLTQPVMIVLIIGLSAVMFAYLLGQWFGQPDGNGYNGQSLHSQPTQPTPVAVRSHSRPTLPLRSDGGQNLHSRPTRPIRAS